jgi:hypothetical protein
MYIRCSECGRVHGRRRDTGRGLGWQADNDVGAVGLELLGQQVG